MKVFILYKCSDISSLQSFNSSLTESFEVFLVLLTTVIIIDGGEISCFFYTLNEDDILISAKLYAPIVVVRGQLDVTEKQSVVLPAWLIQVENIENDTLVDRFTVQLEKLPTSGEIMKVSESQDTLLGEGDMFTLKNLAEGRIWFVHHGSLGQRGKQWSF